MGWGPVARGLAVLAGLAAAAPAFGAPEAGDVQIRAPKGTDVTLEGLESLRVRNGHGVVFTAVPEGAHLVVARRPGHLPQRAVIDVRAHEITIHRFDTWPPPPPRTKGPTGHLVLQTVPANVSVSVPSFGWGKLHKGDAPLVVPGVPAGRHRVTVCTEYKCIDYKADVPKGGLVSLRVRFDPGEVLEDTEHFEATLDEALRRCAAGDGRACKQSCVTELQLGRRAPACEQTPALVADTPPPDPTPTPAARAVPVSVPDDVEAP